VSENNALASAVKQMADWQAPHASQPARNASQGIVSFILNFAAGEMREKLFAIHG
jgi:hypothetical protein